MPNGVLLNVVGNVALGAKGGGGPLTITATESGFKEPTGNSALQLSDATGTFSGANQTDSEFAVGTYNGTTMSGVGPVFGKVDGNQQMESVEATISLAPPPFSLTDSAKITLSKAGATLKAAGTVILVVPEPNGFVVSLTGLTASVGLGPGGGVSPAKQVEEPAMMVLGQGVDRGPELVGGRRGRGAWGQRRGDEKETERIITPRTGGPKGPRAEKLNDSFRPPFLLSII